MRMVCVSTTCVHTTTILKILISSLDINVQAEAEADRLDITGSPRAMEKPPLPNRLTPQKPTSSNGFMYDDAVDMGMDTRTEWDNGDHDGVQGFNGANGTDDIHALDRSGEAGPSRKAMASTDRGSMFLSPKVERDPLVTLNDILTSTAPFLSLLSHLDVPLQTAGVDDSSRDNPGSPRPPRLGIEARMQRHLEKLQEADRIRDEQCRELASLLRDLVGTRWDGLEVDNDVRTGNYTRLKISMEGMDDEKEFESIGWTGDVSAQASGREHDLMESLTSPSDPHDHDPLLDGPPSPVQSSSSNPISSPTFSRPHLPEMLASAPLPHTAHLLISNTNDLLSSLSTLTDSIHSTASFSTAIARQIRGIRASVESWRERETAEDTARQVIEEWERRRLEQGLKGTTGEMREVLGREVKDFGARLDEWKTRMIELRQDTTSRIARPQQA